MEERIGGRLGSCIRRWSEMKRLTLRKIRGRCGEIAETVPRGKKKRKEKECVDRGLDTVKLCYYQLDTGFTYCLGEKTPIRGNNGGRQLSETSLRKQIEQM